MTSTKKNIESVKNSIRNVNNVTTLGALLKSPGLLETVGAFEKELWEEVARNKQLATVLSTGGRYALSVEDVRSIFDKPKTFYDVFKLHCGFVPLHSRKAKLGSSPNNTSHFYVAVTNKGVKISCRSKINGVRHLVCGYQSAGNVLTSIPMDYKFIDSARNWPVIKKCDDISIYVFTEIPGYKGISRWDVVHSTNFDWKTLDQLSVINEAESITDTNSTTLVLNVGHANTTVSNYSHIGGFKFCSGIEGLLEFNIGGVLIEGIGYFTEDKVSVNDEKNTFTVVLSDADANVLPEDIHLFVRNGKPYIIIANPIRYNLHSSIGKKEIAFLTANDMRIPAPYREAADGVFTLYHDFSQADLEKMLEDDPEFAKKVEYWNNNGPSEFKTFSEEVKDKVNQFMNLIKSLIKHVCDLIYAAGDFVKSAYEGADMYLARKLKVIKNFYGLQPIVMTMLIEKLATNMGFLSRTETWMSYAMRILLLTIPYILTCDFLAYDTGGPDMNALIKDDKGFGYEYGCQEGIGKIIASIVMSVFSTDNEEDQEVINIKVGSDTETDSFSSDSDDDEPFREEGPSSSDTMWYSTVVSASVAMAACILPFDDSQMTGLSKKLRSAMLIGSFASLTLTAAWELLPEAFKIIVRTNMGLVDKFYDVKLDVKHISERVIAGDYTDPILMANYYNRLSMDKVILANECTTLRYRREISELIALIDRLTKAMSELEGSATDQDRPVPFFLKMYGPSGLGKSTLMRMINVELVRSITKDVKLTAKAARKHIYSKNEAEKYWSCYHNQILTTFDDYGAFRATSAEDSIAVQMLTLVSCESKILNMPGTDIVSGRKGQRFTSKVITATSNCAIPNLTHLEYPEAYYRRVSMLIKMVKKGQGYQSDKGRNEVVEVEKKRDFSHCEWWICTYAGKGNERIVKPVEKITNVIHLFKRIWATYQIFINSGYDTTEVPSMADYYTDPKWKYSLQDNKVVFEDDNGNMKEFSFEDDPSEAERVLEHSTSEVERISADPILAPKRAATVVISASVMIASGIGMYLIYKKFNDFETQSVGEDPYERKQREYERKANNTKREREKKEFGDRNGYKWTARGWMQNGRLLSHEKAVEIEQRFRAEGGTSIFQTATMKKACAGLQSVDGGFIHSVSVVGGSLILMPNHFTKTLRTGDHYLYRYKSSISQFVKDPVPYFIDFDDYDQYMILSDENDMSVQLDLAICRLDIPDHLRLPNCLDKYLSAYDFNDVCVPNTHLVGLFNGTYTETPVRNVHYKKVISKTHPEEEYSTESFWYESMTMIRDRTRQGDCGRILVSPFNNGTILGLHQGSYCIAARAQYITRERLLALAIQLDYKLVKTLSVDDKFEQQAYEEPMYEEPVFTEQPQISDCFVGHEFAYDRTKCHDIVTKFRNVWNKNDVEPMCELPKNNPSVRLVNTITQPDMMLTSPDKTEYRPSVISEYDGPWGETNMAPAPLKGMFPDPKNPETIRPVSYIAIDKAKQCDFGITKQEYSILKNWLLAVLMDVKSEGVKQSFTLKEALNGVRLNSKGEPIEGTRFGNSFDMATSLGYILGKSVRSKKDVVDSNGKVKDFVKDDSDRNLLEDLCRERIECAKNNCIPWFSLYSIIKKDEPLPAIGTKVRLVYGGPPDLWIVTQAYFGSFHAHTKKFIGRNGPQVGINPLGSDWHALALNLLKVHKIWDGDYSGFDHCGDLTIWSIIADVINEWYHLTTGYVDEEADRIRRMILLEMPWARYVIFDAIIQRVGCLPSGSLLTSCVGSLINILYWMLFIIRHKPDSVNLKFTAEEFNEFFVLCVYSDDNVVGCIKEFFTWFNPDAFASWIKRYGPRYTTVDKKDQGHRTKSLSDIEFLKRSFVRESDGQYWYSKLDYDSCRRMIHWTHRPSEFHMNIRSFMNEIVRYGRKDYENYRNAFVQLNQQIGFIDESSILSRNFDDMINISIYPEYNKCLNVTDDVKSIYVYTLALNSEFTNGETGNSRNKRRRRTVWGTVAHC